MNELASQFIELQLKDLRGIPLSEEEKNLLARMEMAAALVPGALEEMVLRHGLDIEDDDTSEAEPIQLDSIHYGAILTHVDVLLDRIERTLASGVGLVPAREALRQDSVYHRIATGQFRLPTMQSSDPSTQLTERLERLSRISGRGAESLETFLRNIKRFVDGTDDTWDDNGYLTVPVISCNGGIDNPALVYLYSPQLEVPGGHIHVDDLTADPHCRMRTEDYFGSIASVLMNTIYFVNPYPFDERIGLTHHSFRLCFGCRITEGRSIGAAALAMFAIAYLRYKLGDQYQQAIAPQRGTLLTGEIDFDGRVRRVNYLEEKVTFALNEYGRSLKVIVPAEEHLSPQLEDRIERENLYYVSNAEELLSVVLSTPGDGRGLHIARKMLFGQLCEDKNKIEKLRSHLVSGVKADVFTTISSGHSGWLIPQSHEGIFITGQAMSDQVEVRLALEQSALLETPGLNGDKELIEVLIDGGAEMKEQWHAERSGVCNVTAALFEIASALDNATQELVIGFLSDSEFRDIKLGEPAVELEAKLQQLRRSLRLEIRGSFLSPILVQSRKKYGNRQKRVFVLSDAFIPDERDLDDLQVSEYTRLRFSVDARAGAVHVDNHYRGRRTPYLLKDNVLDRDLLNRCFRKSPGAFQAVAIDFGGVMPVEWQPEHGELSWENDRFILRWHLDRARNVGIKVKLATNYRHTVQIFGQIAAESEPRSFSLDYHLSPAVPDAIKHWSQVESGLLEGGDAAKWQVISSRGYICPEPECEASSVHIFHPSDAHIKPRCILSGLRRLERGFILLQKDSPKWRFFRNGCRVNGISFGRMGGNLYWSQAAGRLVRLPFDDDTCVLEVGDAQYYLFRVD